MFNPRRWFSVPFFSPHNQSLSPNGSDLIHSVLGWVSQEPLNFGFELIKLELTATIPKGKCLGGCVKLGPLRSRIWSTRELLGKHLWKIKKGGIRSPQGTYRCRCASCEKRGKRGGLGRKDLRLQWGSEQVLANTMEAPGTVHLSAISRCGQEPACPPCLVIGKPRGGFECCGGSWRWRLSANYTSCSRFFLGESEQHPSARRDDER